MPESVRRSELNSLPPDHTGDLTIHVLSARESREVVALAQLQEFLRCRTLLLPNVPKPINLRCPQATQGTTLHSLSHPTLLK